MKRDSTNSFEDTDNETETLLRLAKQGDVDALDALCNIIMDRLRPIMLDKLDGWSTETREELLRATVLEFREKLDNIQNHPIEAALAILRQKIGSPLRQDVRTFAKEGSPRGQMRKKSAAKKKSHARPPMAMETSAAEADNDELGLGSAASAPPAPSEASQPTEERWLNAEIRDHARDKPLDVGSTYLLDFSVDLKSSGAATIIFPDASSMFNPDEELIELSVHLHSRDFNIRQNTQVLKLGRTGPSLNKASFDIVPQKAGRGTLLATVHKDGNYLLHMEIEYSIGVMEAQPTVLTYGRSVAAGFRLRPRELGLHISPFVGGFDCEVKNESTWQTVVLPISVDALSDAIKVAREGLMKVVLQRDKNSNLIFQIGHEIDPSSAEQALKTLARTGARLFQKIFFGPDTGSDVQAVGNLLKRRATDPNVQLTLQITAKSFPIPWGLLYFGEAGEDAQLSWDSFLGMRHVIEQIPFASSSDVDDFIIQSDKPALAVSVNVNTTIDNKVKDVVAKQITFWDDLAKKQKPHLMVEKRETRSDLLKALRNSANDQLMYLYCHADSANLGDVGGISGSCLILSNQEQVSLDDLNLDAPTTSKLKGNPLVFINACESAELSPEFYDGFVPYFMAKGARGVIGTECKMPARFATEWALRFFPRFLAGESLGNLFLSLRREFLDKHNNPLGLLYTVYCDADTQIQPALNL